MSAFRPTFYTVRKTLRHPTHQNDRFVRSSMPKLFGTFESQNNIHIERVIFGKVMSKSEYDITLELYCSSYIFLMKNVSKERHVPMAVLWFYGY